MTNYSARSIFGYNAMGPSSNLYLVHTVFPRNVLLNTDTDHFIPTLAAMSFNLVILSLPRCSYFCNLHFEDW